MVGTLPSVVGKHSSGGGHALVGGRHALVTRKKGVILRNEPLNARRGVKIDRIFPIIWPNDPVPLHGWGYPPAHEPVKK